MGQQDKTGRSGIALLLLLCVAAVTVAGFVLFKPAYARFTYWVAMIDILALECVVGGFGLRAFFAATRRTASQPSLPIQTAMQIGSAALLGLGLVLTILLIALQRTPGADRVLLWLISVKWVAVVALLLALTLVSRESAGLDAERERVRPTRLDVVDSVERISVALRSVTFRGSDTAQWRRFQDIVDQLRNQAKGWVSAAPTGAASGEPSFAQPASELSGLVGELAAAPADQQNAMVARGIALGTQFSSELRKAGRSPSSGVA